MKSILRKMVSITVVVMLFPVVIYGISPTLIAQVLKWKIEAQDFNIVEVQVGYPTITSIMLGPLIVEGAYAGRAGVLQIDKIVATYTLSQLWSGKLEDIVIETARLEIEASHVQNPATPTASPMTVDTAFVPSLTVGAFLHPIPVLPMQSITLRQFVLIEGRMSKSERAMELSGSFSQNSGRLIGDLNITGSHIPPSRMNVQGTSFAELQVRLTSLDRPEVPALNLSSVLTENKGMVLFSGEIGIDVDRLIPYVDPFLSLPQDIPLATGHIHGNWTGSLPQNVSLSSVADHPEVEVEGDFHVSLEIPHLAGKVKDLSIGLDSKMFVKNKHLRWILSEQSRVSGFLNLAEFAVFAPMMKNQLPTQAKVELTVKEPLQGEVTVVGEELLTANVTGRADVQIQSLDPHMLLRTSLLEGTIINGREIAGKGTFDVSGSFPRVALPLGSAESTQWDCGGEWNGEAQEWQFKIVQGCVLSAQEIHADQMAIPQFRVVVLEPINGRWDGVSQHWQMDSTKLKIQTPQIQWKDQTIGIQESRLRVDVLRGLGKVLEKTQGEMVVLGMTLPPQKGVTIPQINGKVSFEGKLESVMVKMLGQIPQWQVTTKARARHGLTTNRGGADWAIAPVVLSPETLTPSQLLSPWPYPFDVTSGEVSAKGKVNWQLTPSAQEGEAFRYQGGATVEAQGLSGVFQKLLVNDVNVVGTVTKGDAWEMPELATITIKEINPGIPVRDISLRAKISQNPSLGLVLDIHDVTAHTLGGTIGIEALSIDSTIRTSDFTVNIDRFQLTEILKLEQQEGLDGTGVLDGSLPVHVSMEGAEINKGTVNAQSPGGVIFFQASPETAQTLSQYNVNMDIVLEALKNFHYDVLDGQIDYDQDGRLVLHITLQGKNPEFKNGRPIHFNLQVEEDIPALLKSLQITRGIEEQIQKLFQEGCCY